MSSSPERPEYGFVAYIDESGDDGLAKVKPIDENGSSEWLVLAAVVVDAENERETIQWVRKIIGNFRNHQRCDLHFSGLNPAKKLVTCKSIADLPVRCFAVASNKKNMRGYTNPNAAKIPSKNWFYCWMTRILLERVTHFVESKSIDKYGSVKKLKIEYSERGGLSYSQMTAYYEWLKMKSSANNLYLPLGDLAWSVMHRDLLDVYNHTERAGLQLADAVAGSVFKGCDVYDTGACDPQFAMALGKRMGRAPDTATGQISGYGLKLMPNMRKAQLRPEQEAIFRHYGYPKEWWAPAPSNPSAF
ncbi:DUF3800 domain-containing protein [Rhodovibrio salinarum]|uniref:DUF3800 domain-containing protein n=1 Tax=Rhodovibrio salinarum TaxID=1087 RepID=A0A934UYN5_9PROT|nr:DUF3800 domain-containing protein [Rhodovibrio salinarum]MBK1695729.1 DUF3800 domain-containing protein [Rhodovibrio salinarum]